ncbi:MAG: M48 family metallopeptidase [Terracidiphilus sp.]
MTFCKNWWLAFFLAVMLAGVSPDRSSAQANAPVQPTQNQSTAQQGQPGQAYRLPPEKLAKAIVLNRIRVLLDIAGSVWGLAVLWILLASCAVARLAAWTERALRRRWLQGLLFFAVFLVILTLASLPLDVAGHLASRHFGISVQGWGGWLGDQGKALGLTVLIGAPVLLLFNWIVRVSPRRFWMWAWIVSLPILVVSILVEPLIEPLFDKFEPLNKNHPQLVEELEKVVARTGTDIPPDRMFLMKASAKTNGLNAYVTGIGATKRIVVWDTTAGRIPDDEVLFVFGHESGHYVLHHIPKGLTGTAFALFFVFWGCAIFAGWLVKRFGSRWHVDSLSSRAGFVVLLFVLSLAGFLLEPVSNAFSRHFEHQADVYGQEAIHGIVADPQKTAVAGFNALGEAWLEDPDPNPFIEFWTYSHPSVEHRANFAAHYDPWKNGGHGEFFKN